MVTLCKPVNLLLPPAGCTVTHQEVPLVFLLLGHALFMGWTSLVLCILLSSQTWAPAHWKFELELLEWFKVPRVFVWRKEFVVNTSAVAVILEVHKQGHVLSRKKFTQAGIFVLHWMGKYLQFLTPYTTMENKHLAHIERSWKVRRSQCICVMRGLEWRISLTLRNDYGNNMIIFPLSLSSFFLSANPGCCEMGEDFSKCLRDNLWSREWTFPAPLPHSAVMPCLQFEGELKDKVKSSSKVKVPHGSE